MARQTATDLTNDLNEALGEEQLDELELKAIKKKSLRGVMSFFARTVLLQGIGFASALLLSAFLHPEDFGVYGIVVQMIALLTFFSDVGLAASLIQKKTEPSKEDYQTAFTIQQLLSWLIFLLVFLTIRLNLFTEKIGSDGNWVMLALALAFPLATFKTIPSIILERKLDFNKLVLPQIFEQFVFHGILIVLAWKGYGVLAYAYAIVARSLIGVIVMQLIQPWINNLHINRQSLKNLLSFGLKFQANDLLARIKDQLYFLALGAYLPLNQFGYLQWSKNWSLYPYNLTVSNVMSITFPTFSRLQGHKDLLRKAIEKSIYFITVAIFPILVGMSLFIYPLTQVIDKYAKWEPAVISFVLFTLSVAWAAISTPITNALNAIGKINQTLKLMIFWTILTWVLTPILLWKFSYNGVALAALLISFTSVLSVRLLKKYMTVNIWSQVKTQLFAALGMAVVGYLGMNLWVNSFKSMLAGMMLCASSYLALFFLLGSKRFFSEVKSMRKNL
jgi:O-antigen/teichoic acid export membrane protein